MASASCLWLQKQGYFPVKQDPISKHSPPVPPIQEKAGRPSFKIFTVLTLIFVILIVFCKILSDIYTAVSKVIRYK